MRKKRIIVTALSLALVLVFTGGPENYAMTAHATNKDQIQNNINRLNDQLSQINNNIAGMEEQQEILEEEMEDLNAEIINTLTSIGLKEDEITEKEDQIQVKQADIAVAETEYEKAREQEEKQYQDMVIRMRKMYENNDKTGLSLLLEGSGLADILNRMDFVESVYEYDQGMLDQYEQTKTQVLELWNQLEAEKLALENDKKSLEEDRENLQSQKAELDGLLAKKKIQSDNYDAEIKKARQEANVAKKQLQQEQQRLKQLQSGGGGNAANGNYVTNYDSVIDGANGSDLGKKIAKYACQYIGNPYVAGGTSLTNGADCSGFTYRVYSDFGYSLPRTSTQQRSAGTSVEYSQAQPGDLICYDGHVALYIGGGMIVHASTQKTGIKIGNANYRTILAVRRII